MTEAVSQLASGPAESFSRGVLCRTKVSGSTPHNYCHESSQRRTFCDRRLSERSPIIHGDSLHELCQAAASLRDEAHQFVTFSPKVL